MYATVFDVSSSQALTQRVAACAATEQVYGRPPTGDPYQWAYDSRWEWAATPGWGEAWDSAIAGGETDPGAAEDVITDPMILSRVQELAGP